MPCTVATIRFIGPCPGAAIVSARDSRRGDGVPDGGAAPGEQESVERELRVRIALDGRDRAVESIEEAVQRDRVDTPCGDHELVEQGEVADALPATPGGDGQGPAQ